MSEVQNNLGEKFKETITEAMKTGDFHALNTLVTDTVNDALREADFRQICPGKPRKKGVEFPAQLAG